MQSASFQQSAPGNPLVQTPKPLWDAQSPEVHSVSMTHGEPTARSVHRPPPLAVLYAHRPETQSEPETQPSPTAPLVQRSPLQ